MIFYYSLDQWEDLVMFRHPTTYQFATARVKVIEEKVSVDKKLQNQSVCIFLEQTWKDENVVRW
jgi:hypothetical protein